MRRASLIAAAVAATFVVVLGAAAWGLLRTERGLHLAWGFVEARLPPGLAFDHVRGRLTGPVELSGIRYADDRMVVTARRAVADWTLPPLLRRSLNIREAIVEGVRVTILPVDTAHVVDADGPRPDLRLPIRLSLRRAVVRDVEVQGRDEGAEPLVVDSVVTTGVSLADELAVRTLSVASPLGTFELSGSLRPYADYTLRLEARGDVRHARYGAIVGDIEARGTVDSVWVSAALVRPVAVEASGSVLKPLEMGPMKASIIFDDADLQTLLPESPGGRVSANLSVAGVPDSLDVSGSARLVTPATGAVDLEGSLARRADDVRVERLIVRAEGSTLEADGRVSIGSDGRHADLALRWSALRWPLEGQPRFRSRAGTARFTGIPERYEIRTDAEVTMEASRHAAHVFAIGRGTNERIDLAEFRVDALDGRVAGRGSLTWAPDPRWDLHFAASNVETVEVLPDTSAWHGRISFDGRSRGSLVRSTVRAEIILDTLTGVLNEAPVGATVDGSLRMPIASGRPDWQAGDAELRRLEIEWGPNRVTASGMVSDTLALDASVAVPDIGVVTPLATGSFHARGRLSGSRGHPEVTIDSLAIRDFAHDSLSIVAASVTGRVESSPGGRVDLGGVLSGVAFGARAIDSVRFTGLGTIDEHEVTASVRSSFADVDLVASGGTVDRRWTGSIRDLAVGGPRAGRWSLSNPMPVSIGAEAVRIDRGCLGSEPASLCADIDWQKDGPTTVTIEIERLPGQRLASSLPGPWIVDGSLDATASAVLSADGGLTAVAMADLGAGRITYPTSGGSRSLDYSTATASVEVGPSGARTQFESTLADQAGLEVVHIGGDVHLPDFARATDTLRTQAVRGTIAASIQDLGIIEAATTSVDSLAGDLDVDVTLNGTVERPEFLGEARFRNGSADVPQLGLRLREIEITARGRGLDGVTLEGALVSGSGRVGFDGFIPSTPSATSPAEVRLTGTRVQAVSLPEIDVWVSPDLRITAFPERIAIEGEVRVPVARVELSEIPDAAARPSRDVVFVGDTASRPSRARSADLRVRVVLGDSVSFQGYGFSARPRGAFLTRTASGERLTATGEITLEDGRYRAYGQDLTIERGRILFGGGPIEDPGLNVRASRTARDGVVAGLQVVGTLRRPEVTIFSEPAMVESEALAYIVLGRGLQTASASEGSRVAEAATALGIREGNVLAGRIAQRFGLEEVRVEAEGPLEEASLIAGKYLSPRLYVSYGVGLFEPISTFRLRYLLSGRWTLMAESGEASGLDLLYRIERGR